MDGLSKQGQYAFKKMVKRYGNEPDAEKMFRRQMKAGILPKTYLAGERGSWDKKVGERVGAEEELGVKRGRGAWK